MGLLPDQVPPEGLGVWSPVFGKPAYTMTLAARLALQTGATVLLVRCEREPMGRGFVMYAEPLPQPLDADLETAVRQVNEAMEHVIRQCPGQYLWGYGRYKQPEPMPQRWRPRHDESAGCGFMGVLARLPLPVLRAMGAALGRVLFVLVVPRRKVALRNLELCFPQASAQRTQWARESFIVFARPGWIAAGCGPPSVGGGAAREAPGRCA